MKNRIIFSLISFVLLGMTSLQAQRIEISDAQVNHDDKRQACVKVLIDPQPKAVKKAFESFMDDRYDVNMKGIGFLSNKDVLTAEAAKLPAISDKQLDFYARVVENGKGSEMCVFASLGYDIHITPEDYPRRYKAMKGIVLDFLDQYLPTYYKGRIEDSREWVEDLANERENLKEDIADNKEEMEDLRQEIEDLTKENQELAKQLDETKNKLLKAGEQLDERKEKLNTANQKLIKKKTNQ